VNNNPLDNKHWVIVLQLKLPLNIIPAVMLFQLTFHSAIGLRGFLALLSSGCLMAGQANSIACHAVPRAQMETILYLKRLEVGDA
jgi:hypothetical protein